MMTTNGSRSSRAGRRRWTLPGLGVLLLMSGCADARQPLLNDAGAPALAAAPAGSTSRAFSGDRQAAVVGDTLPDMVVVQVLGPDGLPAKGVTVQWTVTSGGGTLVTAGGYTNASGRAYARWKLGTLVGFQTLAVDAQGAGTVTFNARGIPANSRLELVSGNGQSAAADSALALPLTVRLVEPTGTGVEGGRVTWTVVAGGGSLDSAASTTSQAGEASRRWKLGNVPGEQRVRATVRGLPPVEFTATAAMEGVTLSIYAGNGQTGTQYDTLTQNLVVRVARADGTPIEGVTVNWSAAAGGGMKFARTVTNSTGRAYNLWALGPNLGAQQATATLEGAGSVVFSATAVANGRTLSAYSGDGQEGSPGDSLAPLVMRVTDQGGRPIRGVQVSWRVQTGGGALRTATGYTDVDGRAMNRWMLGATLGQQQVRAAVQGSGEVSFNATAVPYAGPQIAFRSNRTGGGRIWITRADGTGQYVIPTSITATDPDWSPDGTRLVFATETGDIHLMNADGSGVTPLVALAGSQRFPAWSPDGERIAFSGDGPSGRGLYVVNVDGTGLTLLRAASEQPAWSPDGARIAFRSTDLGLATMNADGTSPATFGDGSGTAPSWSPDGTRIAYHTDNPECACDDGLVWVRPLAGGAAVMLGWGNEPDWSPDGTRIAFVEYHTYNKYHALGVMNADGSSRYSLENGFGIYAPAWKPVP